MNIFSLPLSAKGICHIRDKDTKQTIVYQENAIHNGNLLVALSESLIGAVGSNITTIAFGNGGTNVTPDGKVFYRTKNVSDTYDPVADLYNTTYLKPITNMGSATPDPTNGVTLEVDTQHVDFNFFVTLDYGEPASQDMEATASSLDEPYVFDELGVKTTNGLLLTHFITSPTQKALDRAFEILYTIRLKLREEDNS